MPRYFAASYISGQSCPASLQAPPVTIAVRFLPVGNAPSFALASVSNNAVTTSRMYLNVNSGTIRAIHADTIPAQGISTSANTVRAGVWNTAVAVFASTSSRTAYCNGIAAPTDTTLVAGAMGLNRTQIGWQQGATACTGFLAEVAYWSEALTQAEVTAYHNGARPDTIRRGNLVVYSRLESLPHVDAYGAVATWTESTTDINLRQAPLYTPRPYTRKSFGAGFAATVDLNVTGAEMSFAGGTFDLIQATSSSSGGNVLRRRRRFD